MKRLAAVLAILAAAASAETGAEAAARAADTLKAASEALAGARRAEDRVAALTDTVRAFEQGLSAMREGLRAAAAREAALDRDLARQEREIASLLGVLSALGETGRPVSLLHPEGPLGTARSGMLMAAVMPGLSAEVEALRRDLAAVETQRGIQTRAAEQLEQGLSEVQEARRALSRAISDRRDLPRRFTADPVRTAILIAAAETLDSFAGGLDQITRTEAPPLTDRIDARKGRLPLPVAGTILRRAGEADAAGVARPGIVLATGPRALVVTPAPATIRYTGPLLDYGLVTILEPQTDLLIVLAGLAEVYGEAGEILGEAAPVGLMGGDPAGSGQILSPSGEGGGADATETLYIEVREGNAPVDPLTWFERR